MYWRNRNDRNRRRSRSRSRSRIPRRVSDINALQRETVATQDPRRYSFPQEANELTAPPTSPVAPPTVLAPDSFSLESSSTPFLEPVTESTESYPVLSTWTPPTPRAPPPSAITETITFHKDTKDWQIVIPEEQEEKKRYFQCQLAHGSTVKQIGAFSNTQQLYKAIAEQFDEVDEDEILYCTTGSHKLDVNKIIMGFVHLGEMIFVHIRGETDYLHVMKTQSNLGLTISDNGAGKAYIKRITEGSPASRAAGLAVGQHIESVNGKSMVGLRHYDVARILRNIPEGESISLAVVNPMKSGFSFLAPRSANRAPAKKSVEDGHVTLRFKADGEAVLEKDAPDTKLLSKVNELFESYLGVNDDQLAMEVCDLVRGVSSLPELSAALAKSNLALFGFPDELLFDVWGVLGDLRTNRI